MRPPLGVAGGDDPPSRGANLRELRPHLRREALVLVHEPGGRANGLDQPRLVEQGGIVDQRRHRLAAGGQRCDGTVGAGRELDRPARRVDVAASFDPVGDLERRVAEGAGEPVAHRPRASAFAARRRDPGLPGRRTRDHRISATIATGRHTKVALASVSNVGASPSIAITRPSQARPTRVATAAAASSGPCKRRATPRATRSRCSTSRSTITPTAAPVASCTRSTPWAAPGSARRRAGRERRARRARRRAARRASRRARPRPRAGPGASRAGAPGNREPDGERRDPQPLEQEPERPRSREVDHSRSAARSRSAAAASADGGPAPARPLDDEHRRHGERPGEREIGRDPRPRDTGVDSEQTLSRGPRERRPATRAPDRGSGLCSRPRPAR